MILKFHEDVLKLFPADFFTKLKDNKYITKELFLKGTHYPDVPCAELVKTTEDIKYLNYNPCEIPGNLAYLFFEDQMGLTETVQSHRGRQAIGHSMTYDPKVTMIQLRQKILRRLEILYMLSLEDVSIVEKCINTECKVCYQEKSFFNETNYKCPKSQPNIFWLGQIIHCIYDSYSRVHTLRLMPKKSISKWENFTKNKTKNQYEYEIKDDELYKDNKVDNDDDDNDEKGRKKFSERELESNPFILIRMMGNMIDKTDIKLEGGTDEYIMEYIKVNLSNADDFLELSEERRGQILGLIEENPKRIAHIFKMVLFFKNQKMNFKKLYKTKKDYPSYKNLNKNESEYINYPYIVSFRYIGHQKKCSKTFHYNYDHFDKTNEMGFVEYMNENAKVAINMYLEHILDKKKRIQDKIEEFINYIARNVFPIPKKYHNNPSAYFCNHKKDCACNIEKEEVYNLFLEHYEEKNDDDMIGGYYHKKYLKYSDKKK